ncbi:MAG: TIGR01212 family radical SAM protein, partial [Treponema sp.]|nr:TIGR01212 family radical SAM protein [Treponema sp.]
MLTLSLFYQSIFSCKTYKLSLDAGCTCPNRDGTKGRGGCVFCSERGSGDFASERNLSVKEQVEQAKKRVEAKVKGRSGNRKGKYIAYFQNFTSTYGEPEILAQKYRQALECEDVEGLAIATRPDCLSEEILSKISEISKNHFV